ncbi:hypothetical protein BGX21_009725 [Mortierella sp. AD011]|nr:hypothetical protein BGX20_006861 [Mortierella sp. AD010]KAF9395963.1 hypothetical protein BGX21_009725 [Mortierella sp. AD011]
MKITLLSTLSVLGLGLITAEAGENVVRIDANKGLVCLILPPPGKMIGDTQQDGHVQCTDGNPQLLPSNFFVSKKFKTTSDYVQAWGLMNDESVGLLKNDGGGQYDIHKDSGTNRAEGYPVFVELLEPDTGRWCIRFCPKLNTACNMGKSSYGCEGALGITDWPTSGGTSSSSNNTTASGTTTAASSAKSTSSAKGASSTGASKSSTAAVSVPTGNSTVSTTAPTSTSSTNATVTPKAATSSSVKTSFNSVVPLAILASAVYTLFL